MLGAVSAEADETTDMPSRPMPPIVAVVLGICAALALGYASFSNEWLYAGSTQLQHHEDNSLPYTLGPVHEISIGLRGVERCTIYDGNRRCFEFSTSGLLEDWEKELMEARYMAEEPVDTEAKALLGDERYASMEARRSIHQGDLAHLALAQKELAYAKRIYAGSSAWPLLGTIAWLCCLIAALSLAVAVVIVLAGKRVRLPIMPTTTALLGIAVALITGCVFVAMKPGPPGYVGVGLGFFVFGGGVVLGMWSTLMLNKLMRPHDPDLLEDAMNPDEFE
jgi:hypothetical protein